LQSIIYQKQYQEAIKKQLDGIIDNLSGQQFTTVADYLQQSYYNGYTGVMYDLHQQGIPIISPINQEQVTRAIKLESKISKGLYTRMGEDTTYLKKSIRAELSRGISNGSSWNEIAGHIAKGMNSPFNRAYNNAIRISRTEGHRIQQKSALDAQMAAKESGADIVKQWCATLDEVTRETHQQLDGQIREVDEYFEIGGRHVAYPGGFGDPAEDCNCRCCILQRAKWALDQDELATLEERAAYFGLDKTSDFDEFKDKYLQLPDNADTINVSEYDVLDHTQKLKAAMNEADYKEYTKILTEHENGSLKKLYSKYADGISGISFGNGNGYYSPSGNNLVFSYPQQKYIANGKSKYSTLAHEYAHYFDDKAEYSDLHFAELDTVYKFTKSGKARLAKVASSSDEFLKAVREDRAYLRSILTDEVKTNLGNDDASCGVQDAIDGLLGERIMWGHGDKYYNRKYAGFKKLGDHKGLQTAYKELGLDASNLSKTGQECRIYESASEMWANISSAEVNGGKELEYVKKYLPNSYKAVIQILKKVK
jgi:hypothetical protein